MKIIEALNHSGTVAFYDEATNQRTQWILLELDEPISEAREKDDFLEIVKDYIEDAQAEWVSADDLEDENGQILYTEIQEGKA